MPLQHLTAVLSPTTRLAYLDQARSADVNQSIGTIVLIHGFPQTSHQFRHVLPLLSERGYRIIAPDYRGAGNSSKLATTDFRKSTMAADMIALLDHLNVKEAVHVVGHDIGGMIAYAMAARYPDRVRSVTWGECPLPGTDMYRRARTEKVVDYFHFIFQSVPDLSEALVIGKERMYVEHFFRSLIHNQAAFSEDDVDFYARQYARPGALRAAFGVYRAFEEDAKENLKWLKKKGKCRIPSMVLNGEMSRHREGAEAMVCEVTEKNAVEIGLLEGAGHWLAEENPMGFAKKVLEFVAKH